MDASSALIELQAPQDLTILALSAPYLSLNPTVTPKGNSNASSNDSRENATPAILSADLTHYQELFSKLRFSYVEQVTKERFLRAITAEQPEFIDASENAELEEQLREDKAALKERKQEVREMVRELEEQGRSLASREFWEEVAIVRKNRADVLMQVTTTSDSKRHNWNPYQTKSPTSKQPSPTCANPKVRDPIIPPSPFRCKQPLPSSASARTN